MFETQYNEEMAQEVLRLEALKRACDAGHPEWKNACVVCCGELATIEHQCCEWCRG